MCVYTSMYGHESFLKDLQKILSIPAFHCCGLSQRKRWSCTFDPKYGDLTQGALHQNRQQGKFSVNSTEATLLQVVVQSSDYSTFTFYKSTATPSVRFMNVMKEIISPKRRFLAQKWANKSFHWSVFQRFWLPESHSRSYFIALYGASLTFFIIIKAAHPIWVSLPLDLLFFLVHMTWHKKSPWLLSGTTSL